MGRQLAAALLASAKSRGAGGLGRPFPRDQEREAGAGLPPPFLRLQKAGARAGLFPETRGAKRAAACRRLLCVCKS